MTGRSRSPRLLAAVGLILLWWTAGAILALAFSERIRDWSVMTDELQYVKLALSVAETHSPVPSIHGAAVAATNQLYPLLLAPVYGSLSSPEAFRAAHVLNSVVMTSAALPAYLLARQLLDRAWSFAVALLTVITPWMVLTGFLMSEVVAYPAFAWAMLASHRAVAEPSPRRDLLAAAALGVAILARTQFTALALVLPLAILVHEVAHARASYGVNRVRGKLASGARAAARRHRALWGVYAAGTAVAGVLVLSGRELFGAYATTVESGSPLPSGVWLSAVRHLDVVGIGCGLVPLLLGGGWMVSTLVRPHSRERHAFASLAGITVAALAIQTASFDLRFGGADVIRDRYLFYVVPLLLVGSAAALTEGRRRSVAVGVATVAMLVAATVPGLAFPTFPGISVDSPVSILNETLSEQSGTLRTGAFVAIATLLAGAVLVLALLLASSRIPLALVLFATLTTFSLLMLRSEVDRILAGTSLAGRPLAGPPGLVLDWVDSVVPEGETAAIVPFPVSTAWGVSAIQWWDVEFWNRSVSRSYRAQDENFTYTNFPQRTLEIDRVTGVIEGTADAPRFVVAAAGDPRFGLAGQEHATNLGFVVMAVDRPYRAVWSSFGLSTDGWTRPAVPVSIRIHARTGEQAEVKRVRIGLTAPDGDIQYRISTETADRPGTVPARSSVEETVFVCVTPGSPVDVTITTSTSVQVESAPLTPEIGPTRLVGARVGPVVVRPTGRPCTD